MNKKFEDWCLNMEDELNAVFEGTVENDTKASFLRYGNCIYIDIPREFLYETS